MLRSLKLLPFLAVTSLFLSMQSSSAAAIKFGVFKEGQIWTISWKGGKRQVTIPTVFMEEDGRNGLYEFIGSQNQGDLITRAVQWGAGNKQNIPPHAFIRIRAANPSPSATLENAMIDLAYCLFRNPKPVQKGQSLTGVLANGADNDVKVANAAKLYVTTNKAVSLPTCTMTRIK